MLWIVAGIIVFIVIVLAVIIGLYMSFNPVFGGNLTEGQKQNYERFDHFVNGKFINKQPTNMNIRLSEYPSMIKDFLIGSGDRSPKKQLNIADINWDNIKSEEDSLTWFGHSSFLVSLDNKKILVDPVLSLRASPVSFAGGKRYTGNLLSIIDNLPKLDIILITHDHYDHLDYHSIVRLKEKTNHFCVPLGVSNHLIRWGIAKEKITECNWWDEIELNGLKLAFTPSRHFSGRGLFNRDTTLWGGWVILGSKTRFYTSGDGGYGQHFKEIERKYGPFDIALMEGGQYDRRWSAIHMTPEEAIQAYQDIKGKAMMLIHWGAFTLANHAWTDPIERAVRAARNSDIKLITPQIGETVALNGSVPAITRWWEQ